MVLRPLGQKKLKKEIKRMYEPLDLSPQEILGILYLKKQQPDLLHKSFYVGNVGIHYYTSPKFQLNSSWDQDIFYNGEAPYDKLINLDYQRQVKFYSRRTEIKEVRSPYTCKKISILPPLKFLGFSLDVVDVFDYTTGLGGIEVEPRDYKESILVNLKALKFRVAGLYLALAEYLDPTILSKAPNPIKKERVRRFVYALLSQSVEKAKEESEKAIDKLRESSGRWTHLNYSDRKKAYNVFIQQLARRPKKYRTTDKEVLIQKIKEDYKELLSVSTNKL